MSFSFTIARVFGIPLRVHGLFLLLVAALAIAGGPHGESIATLLAILFASVLFHELGHSLVARTLGARILDITLWPLGGLSRMEGMPERPREELLIALAGPATNALLLAVAALFGAHVAPSALGAGAHSLDTFATIQASLALFNLVPAFPMDGGRALRALLAARYGRLNATELAVRVGRWCAVLAIAASLFVDGLFVPVAAIGAFLLIQGWIELRTVRARFGRDPLFEMLQRATRPQPPRPGEAPPSPARPRGTGDGDGGASIPDELEQFRGTMEEYFEQKKRDR